MSNTTDWTPPDLDDLTYTQDIGSDSIEQFARSHSPADMLKEVVQNEYDAGGRVLDLQFGATALSIIGSGDNIDRDGWQRLSMWFGTGRIVGGTRAGQSIRPKVSGIGSKNFGIRSLFLLGDRIIVRSGGQFTVLDVTKGTLPAPQRDAMPAPHKGVHIFIPYRTVASGNLEVFDVEHERAYLDGMSQSLDTLLIKLAEPRSGRSLQRLTISSERLDRTIQWHQSVKSVSIPARKDFSAIRRSIIVRDSDRSDGVMRVEEVEFQRVVTPKVAPPSSVPGYYRVSRSKRVRLGVSFEVKRKRIVRAPGRFFYPLAVSGHTGTSLSINAPFEMNDNRSEILDAATNQWNNWLIEEASDLAVYLLTGDWWRRFGADAYAALTPFPGAATQRVIEAIHERLRREPVWPTDSSDRGDTFAIARDLVVTDDEFRGFLSPSKYIAKQAQAQADVSALASSSGARLFSLNSLVRLRCAGQEQSGLSTKLDDGEASFYFANFPDGWRDLDTQRRFAGALELHRRRLTPSHRSDLMQAETTMTAADSLAAPGLPLFAVPPDITLTSRVPLDSQLHPALFAFKALASLCTPFSPDAWASDVALRAQTSEATDAEREALYRFVLSSYGVLGQKSLSVIRKSPVLRDHRGEWAMPTSIISRKASNAQRFAPALSFPHKEYERDAELLRTLRVRSTISGEDVLRFARLIANAPQLPERLEAALERVPSLLTGRTLTALRDVAFLRSSTGNIARPSALYIRNKVTEGSLGESAQYVGGPRVGLYRRLGCREQPSAEDIIAYLNEMRGEGRSVSQPSVLYPALVSSLHGGAASAYSEQRIVQLGNNWYCPADVLLGGQHAQTFLQAVPCTTAPGALQQAFAALGAHRTPRERHWNTLLQWFAEHRGNGEVLSRAERRAVLNAYRHIESIPADLSFRPYLLGADGRLYSHADVISEQFLIDDDPSLRRSVEAQSVDVVFADIPDIDTRRFFVGEEVHLLSGARTHGGVLRGEVATSPPWLSTLIERLRPNGRAAAIASFVTHQLSGVNAAIPLRAADFIQRVEGIKDVVMLLSLDVEYRLRGQRVVVAADYALDGDVICIRKQRPEAGRDAVARCLAELATDDVLLQRQLADGINLLLSFASPRDVTRHLESRGITLGRARGDDELLDDEDNEDERDDDDVERAIKDKLLAGIVFGRDGASPTQKPPQPQPNPQKDADATKKPPEPKKLPPIESVLPLRPAAEVAWSPPPPGRSKSVGGLSFSSWTPRTPAEREYDGELGKRGERLVYDREVAKWGADRVVWTANNNEAADHDILSVADDGGHLFIEVKSTTGLHGKFHWPYNEFALALRERGRYMLTRVFEADTEAPTCREELDPIGLWLDGQMGINIGTLDAEIAPSGPDSDDGSVVPDTIANQPTDEQPASY